MSDAYRFEARPFPDSAWDEEWRAMANHPVSCLASGWVKSITITPPPPDHCIEVECRAVWAATSERAKRLGDILAQCDSLDAVLLPMETVLLKIHTPRKTERPATRAMMEAAVTDLASGLFTLKAEFKRGRPYHCCDLPLDPMFMRDDPRYPGHPSYPSGHSSQAHTFALLYSEIFPGLKQALLAAAYSVGRNREVAGLHYGSDTDAGLELARQFVTLLLQNGKFTTLLAAARQEWL